MRFFMCGLFWLLLNAAIHAETKDALSNSKKQSVELPSKQVSDSAPVDLSKPVDGEISKTSSSPIAVPTNSGLVSSPLQFMWGGVATLIGLPSLFRLGPEFRFQESWGLSLEYGFIPTLSSLIKFQFSSLRITPKVYPFQGDFFLGVAAGMQQFRYESISLVFGTDVRELSTAFLAPHIGWRWGSKKGNGKIFTGMEFGVQIAVSTTATYSSGASDATQATDAYKSYKAAVEKEGSIVGGTTVAHFALLQYGFMF